MSRALIERIRIHARYEPQRIAIETATVRLSYRTLVQQIDALVAELGMAEDDEAIAILADNGIDWALADLAATAAGYTVVPLPTFFSEQQVRHAIETAGIRRVLSDRAERLAAWLPQRDSQALQIVPGLRHMCLTTATRPAAYPPGTAKISFTSGTTGQPKGVCLGHDTLERAIEALAVASAANDQDRHLCVMPLATLLENIGGLYVALRVGATCCLPTPGEVGLIGSQGFSARACLAALRDYRASTSILVPQLLNALVATLESAEAVPSLRYLAVGGAPLPTGLLQRASQLGLPVFQGYGLTECASVVAVNRPGANRPGSVGQPLPHLDITLAEDGEILVRGGGTNPYIGAGEPLEQPLATGDLGRFDADGYLYVTGRKKNMFITAYGRNVAPEWVESELTLHAPILQAAVFGEGQPHNVAVILPAPGCPSKLIDRALELANQRLPDYARVRHWLPASEPFSVANDQLTGTGRLRRQTIAAVYDAAIQQFHAKECHG